MTTHLRLEVGAPATPTDLLGDAYSLTVRRGLDLDGVTDEPSPAAFSVVIKGSVTANPLTNVDVRPGRPIRLLAGIEDPYTSTITWHTIWAGQILRGRIEHTTAAKHDPDAYRVQITATDLTPALAATPSETAVSGNLTQRANAVLTGTGIPYTVTDLEPATSSAALLTDAKTALGQLRLIRDTLHSSMFVDKTNVLRLVADNSRSRIILTPHHVATDEDMAPAAAILYHDITPVFDTDSLVNALTIKTLTAPDNLETTYTDEASRAAWGPHAQTVTVNDGLAETHAGLYLATRTEPDLIPQRLAFAVDTYTDTHTAHLAAACTIEIGNTLDVTRLGVTYRMTVYELTHTISYVAEPVARLRWTVDVGLRISDVLATRWNDVPATLTWDNVPAALTWDSAVKWHPYRGE